MIPELTELLSRAIEESLEDRTAISFSGGLDSTIIASVAKKHSQIELFTAGVANSDDVESSRSAAKEMEMTLNAIIIDKKMVMQAYGKCYEMLKLDFLRLGILVPVYCVAEEAAKKGHNVLLFGTAAEELFVGYERYYKYLDEGNDLEALLKEEYKTLPQREITWTKKICRKFGIDARFPFYNKELAKFMFSIPLEERMHERELKKGILREAARMLGVPACAVMRRKKAMQYGSGTHKLLKRYSGELNRLYPPA
ncbi:MAG: asparagine synthase C-terminal domain-containing protein [Candidatus Micrarchaeota archaeon]